MMRTYTRKRPKNQLIEDVHELCRLCLNKAMEAKPIFSDDSENVCATLALRIMICVGFEVTKEDCLPNSICTDCYNELNKYYAFRKRCEVTYQKLKSHVLAVKEKQYKQRLLDEIENKNKLNEVQDEEDLKFVVTFDKDQFTGVHNILNLNGVAQVNNFVAQKLPVLSNKIDSMEIEISEQSPEDLVSMSQKSETTHYVQPNKEIGIQGQEPQEADTSDPDITTFISTMLIELGILTQQDDGLVYTNHNIKTLELDTGDGSQVMLELMEEDDVEEQVQEQIADESQNSIVKVEDTSQENDFAIRSATPKILSKKEQKADKKCISAWCSECGKRLASRSALSRHLRVHSGERPYACQVCGRRFAQREVMLRHLLVHEEQRPHKCPSCDKSFTQRGALVTHTRAHAPPDARPLALHRCDRCPKVFLYASGLSRHMMMHNGRVYVCGACERQFKDKSSLLRHLKNANHAPRDNAPT